MKTNSEQLQPVRFLTRTGATRAFMMPPRLDDSVDERIVDMVIAEKPKPYDTDTDDLDRLRGTSKRWHLIHSLSAIARIAADIADVTPRHRQEAEAIVAVVNDALTLIERGVRGAR